MNAAFNLYSIAGLVSAWLMNRNKRKKLPKTKIYFLMLIRDNKRLNELVIQKDNNFFRPIIPDIKKVGFTI